MSNLPTALAASMRATRRLAAQLECHACRRPPGHACACELRIEHALTLIRQALTPPWARPRALPRGLRWR